MQLDLFADSRGAILRTKLLDALRARDRAAGRKACARLAAESPQDALLAPATLLLDQLGRRLRPFNDAPAAQRAIDRIEREVAPAALQVFGPAKADEWLAPLWLALADAMAALPFDPEAPDAHAAGVLVRMRQWQRARAAAETIASWRSFPRPLSWMSRITFELDGLEAAWPLLAELAWLDPAGFAALARGIAAPSLARLLREFDRDFVAGDDTDFAWFPAWAQLADPGLASALRDARTCENGAPEQAARTVMQLLNLERQGRQYEAAAKQKALRGLHEELFARYMATRG
ncbi:hypothetical protein [Azoarcus sp. KH32C]|uniref:hypothetical protein n=1 Tax=Azoarcus sp. KH32C TaxID=748247 RepID=UPI00023861A3|nr:hypothetical protein [Azoarcus sp. KH32C]BAL25694.1 hypothetical protein AZKH_3405 [Azoarcus sp. KH32C]